MALLAEGKNADAQISSGHALALSGQSDDVIARFEASLAAASVQANAGKIDTSAKALEAVGLKAQGYGFAEYPLEARLSLAQLELKSGKGTAARSRFRDLENDARNKGFLLIARKASTEMNAH